MPNENGYALIRRIRTTVDADRLPAAALSAYVDGDSRERALDAGFQTYLSKPIEPTLLAIDARVARPSRPPVIVRQRRGGGSLLFAALNSLAGHLNSLFVRRVARRVAQGEHSWPTARHDQHVDCLQV